MQEFSVAKKQENVYYNLMQQVGINGKYQTIMIVFACILFFQNGLLSLGTPYYFAVAPYSQCQQPFNGVPQCTKYVCSLPFQQRAQFIQKDIGQLRTLGNQFGDYHCSESDKIEIAKGLPFFGALFGFFVTGILGDNIGRKITILICIISGILGYSIILMSKNLIEAQIGLFICGFGVEPSFNIGFTFLSEVLENVKRQKMEILTQSVFCASGLIIILLFFLIKSWTTIFFVFCLIPLILCLIICLFLIKQTPQFLIKRYSVKQIRNNLRFIAKVNGKEDCFDQNEKLSERAIQTIKNQYNEQLQKSQKRAFTYLDLIRYKSLRLTTICITLVFTSTVFLYYAPLMLISQFGFDFYINGVIINISELVTYPFSFFAIPNMRRKRMNLITSSISFVCSLSLIFLHTKQICTGDCWSMKVVVELIIIFVLRFCASLQYQLLFVYVTELYPAQVSSLALGINCLIGCVPVIFLNQLINICNRVNFPIMAVFCIISFISICFILPLEQTFGKQPTERVKEIQFGEERKDGLELVEQNS